MSLARARLHARIPADVRARAEKAGGGEPDWYAGRLNRDPFDTAPISNQERKRLRELVARHRARRRRGRVVALRAWLRHPVRFVRRSRDIAPDSLEASTRHLGSLDDVTPDT